MKKENFDWHGAPLSILTRVDKGYRNTQNVRRFFKKQLGDHFKFNREFMRWLKTTKGITLGDAVKYWKANHA